MKKIILTPEHKRKREVRHPFSIRFDIFGTYLQRKLSQEDYFDYCRELPDEASKILLDGMYGGDWFSVYESDVLPLRHNQFLDRLREGGVDIMARHISELHARGKEAWITHRISEVDLDTAENPHTVKEEHPEWFIPAFDRLMNNMAVPEMREHKLRVLEELVRKYDVDGLDIDFERHTPILPPGKQWQLRECVTDFMRKLRRTVLDAAEEKGHPILLSARVPDCLSGCHEDGLDVETWYDEGLIDALTLGSRSFDVRCDEVRRRCPDIAIYACYDPHHTVDGYAFPELELLRGVWHSHLVRGADGIEYFNWSGEARPDLVTKYIEKYELDPIRDDLSRFAHEDFHGANDPEFLSACDKTYPVERRGGYPWGVGYGNMNAHSPLPLTLDGEGEIKIFVSDRISGYRSATLSLLTGEYDGDIEIYLDGTRLDFTAAPKRDLQVTGSPEAPISGYGVTSRLLKGIDASYPCVMHTADISDSSGGGGYMTVRIVHRGRITVEKLEISLKEKMK